MAKPVTLPTIATDANLSSGTESGSTVILEPSAGVKTQGFVPGRTFVARHWNWWANLVYQWISYVNGLDSDAQFLNSIFVWTNAHVWNGALGPGLRSTSATELLYCAADGSASSRSRTIQIPVMGGLSEDGSVPSVLYRTTSTGQLTFPIDASPQKAIWPLRLPAGSTITGVRAVVEPGAGTGNMVLALHRHTPNYGTFAIAVSTTTLDTSSGTAAQLLDSGAVSHAVTNSTQAWSVSISNDNNTANAYVNALEITFSDPGPRNY